MEFCSAVGWWNNFYDIHYVAEYDRKIPTQMGVKPPFENNLHCSKMTEEQ